MPRYLCPECKAILERTTAVDPNKKIKCPKCQTIFGAKPMPEKSASANKKNPASSAKVPETAHSSKPSASQPSSPVKKPYDDDEEDSSGYMVAPESNSPAHSVNFGDIRDKYPKSKRGPAMAKTVRAANFLTGSGILTCLLAAFSLVLGMWPFIFRDADKEITQAVKTRCTIYFVSGSVGFILGSLICIGASKLHTLESKPWAYVGTILNILVGISALSSAGMQNFGDKVLVHSTVSYFYFLYGSMTFIGTTLSLLCLKDEEVLAGFEETLDINDPKRKKERERLAALAAEEEDDEDDED